MLPIFNNYWMRLSVMSKIIKAKVGVICRSRLDNSRYHAKTEFTSYFIIHIRFIPTSYKFNYFDMYEMLELLYLGYVHTVTFSHRFLLFGSKLEFPWDCGTIQGHTKTLPRARSLNLKNVFVVAGVSILFVDVTS